MNFSTGGQANGRVGDDCSGNDGERTTNDFRALSGRPGHVLHVCIPPLGVQNPQVHPSQASPAHTYTVGLKGRPGVSMSRLLAGLQASRATVRHDIVSLRCLKTREDQTDRPRRRQKSSLSMRTKKQTAPDSILDQRDRANKQTDKTGNDLQCIYADFHRHRERCLKAREEPAHAYTWATL